jgi:toxin ParE1/3/4
MALKLVFRAAAQADLDALDDYIAQDSPRQAAAFVQKIIERCDRLTEFPETGRLRNDLRPGLRLIALKRRVVIAYRVTPEAVEIGRVFYGGRDVDALLAGEPDEG